MRLPVAPETYDASYYGAEGVEPKANYRAYGPDASPHWSPPLAILLKTVGDPPLLDLGAAFGHLCRDYGPGAVACEWSPYASALHVNETMVRADGRCLPFADETFGTVSSLDFLEHQVEDDVRAAVAEIARVLRPGALTVHLVGSFEDGADFSHHTSDPTHQCHRPLTWYRGLFEDAGLHEAAVTCELLNSHPAWRGTDWVGRWVAYRKGVAVE